MISGIVTCFNSMPHIGECLARMSWVDELIVVDSFFNFSRNYIFRLGFLDGERGLIPAVLSSRCVAEKYARLWDLSRKAGRDHGAGRNRPDR